MASQTISSTNPRYIKHPTAESGWVSDGEALDAGSGIIIANNLAHLRNESYKHLVHSTGDIYPPQDDGTGWDEINDGSAIIGDPDTQPDELQISWSKRVSMIYGPFVIPQDRELSDGRKALRNVVVHVGTYNNTGTNLKIYCYLTPNKNNPSLGYYAKATKTTSTSGTEYNRILLSSTEPSLENYPMPAENGSTIQCRQVYLWVGFKMPAGSDVLSVSAFEGSIPFSAAITAEYAEDNNYSIPSLAETKTISFPSSFSSTPIVIAQTVSSSNNLDNVNVFIDSISTSSFTVKFSSAFSGSIKYKAIYSPTYPANIPSTSIVASAGSVTLSNEASKTITYASIGSIPTQLYLTPQELNNDNTADVSVAKTSGTSIGVTSSDITVSTAISDKINFIVMT